jgi:6-phospho-beta-glucosidase
VKLVAIGGGGFRTPGMVDALLAAPDLGVDELVLHDVDGRRLERIVDVLDGLFAERGASLPVRTTTVLDDAVEGAGAVFCAIRVGGLEARLADERVPLELGLLGQETVGAGGIASALRTVPVMLEIAEQVAASSPDAWLVNYTNPAGLVTEALRQVLGNRVIGICDAPPALFRGVAHALGRSDLEFEYGGLNHLGWLRAVRSGGRDLLPELLADDARLARFTEGSIFPGELLRTLGRIPNEYLVYYYAGREIAAGLRREGSRAEVLLELERAFYTGGDGDALAAWRAALRRRSATYFAEVNGGGAEEDVPPDGGLGGYTGVALGVLRALWSGTAATLVLNTANRGALPFLDDDAVVEVPCVVDSDGVQPLPANGWSLHEQGLISLIKDVERTTIAAATGRSRALAVRALALHPLVGSLEAAEAIVSRHPDLRERFA